MIDSRFEGALSIIENWLREHQPAILAAMRPGVSDDELNELERTVGHRLPADVRAFYRWRGGITQQAMDEAQLPGFHQIDQRQLPLKEIASEYEQQCAQGQNSATDRSIVHWNAAWISLFKSSSYIAVDVNGIWTGNQGQMLKVFPDKSPTILAPSLASWLSAHVESLSTGLFNFFGSRFPPGYPFKTPDGYDQCEQLVPGPCRFRIGDRVRIVNSLAWEAYTDQVWEVYQFTAGDWLIRLWNVIDEYVLSEPVQSANLELVVRADHISMADRWNGCQNAQELFSLLGFAISPRKLRLFIVGCCRRYCTRWCEDAAEFLDQNELVADGVIKPGEMLDDAPAMMDRVAARYGLHQEDLYSDWNAFATLRDGGYITDESSRHALAGVGDRCCELIRDVFSNPFVHPAFEPEWRTSTAVALAQGMYKSRDFSAMPILADALQDAGCDNADILDHCRGPGPHVRGCWVVDLVLGKE